jgi:hypothetical protein
MLFLGSAHPLQFNDTCSLNVEPMQNLLGTAFKVNVYMVCADRPNTKVVINSYKSAFMPYFHSWGKSTNYVVLPHQNFHLDFVDLMVWGKTIGQSFDSVSNPDTTIMVLY